MIGTLLLWHVIGATSSDDGYNLTIARVAGHAGYVANYYRYFGATEAPFDWYPIGAGPVGVGEHRRSVDATARDAGRHGMWLIISRCMLRRLGPARGLAGNRVAVLTAGAVFLAAWLPFNNGLRPEPLIALGTVAAWVLAETAIASRRLVPAAVAIIVAVLTATLAPQGLIAVAALLTGSRPIARIIARRRATDGLLAPLAVLAASLSLIIVVVFRSQTLATVAEAARIKYKVGPTIAWYQEFLRYYFLTVEKQRRGFDDTAVRRADHDALPVRDAGRAATARQGARRGQRAGLAADRRHRDRPAAAARSRRRSGRFSSARSPGWPARWARSPRSPWPGSDCTTAGT